MKVVMIFLILVFVPALSFAKLFGEQLKLSAIEGKAPLTVHILGPKILTQKSSKKFSKWVGCEFNIDWGDGTSPQLNLGEECSKNLTHTYQTPGAYKLKASVIHANADDSHTTDWEDDVSVTVK